jgi:hypothetical protein
VEQVGFVSLYPEDAISPKHWKISLLQHCVIIQKVKAQISWEIVLRLLITISSKEVSM